jgi:hypothetical protein
MEQVSCSHFSGSLHNNGIKVENVLSCLCREFPKISKAPFDIENDKQIVLALKWSFEKSPNFY